MLSSHIVSCGSAICPIMRQPNHKEISNRRRFYALEFIAIEVFDAELLPFELFDWLPCVRVHHQKHAYIHLRVWEMQADLLFVPLDNLIVIVFYIQLCFPYSRVIAIERGNNKDRSIA